MTLMLIAATAIALTAAYTRIRYWRYIVVGVPAVTLMIAGFSLLHLAGASPVALAAFGTAMLAVKGWAKYRAYQLTKRERVRAAYRFSTARCPVCGDSKERGPGMCAECESLLDTARQARALARTRTARAA